MSNVQYVISKSRPGMKHHILDNVDNGIARTLCGVLLGSYTMISQVQKVPDREVCKHCNDVRVYGYRRSFNVFPTGM